ncbi:MAG TPA: hypothetical protein PKV71_12335 [Calditrichia bacterium]|nr:hypothetical protein [Calditrichota bacterium]HQU74420.1 hypothetical protein [Calditrichia bacterium]HQV32662.1 hypothetical protein [Calditrichia bacterium]
MAEMTNGRVLWRKPDPREKIHPEIARVLELFLACTDRAIRYRLVINPNTLKCGGKRGEISLANLAKISRTRRMPPDPRLTARFIHPDILEITHRGGSKVHRYYIRVGEKRLSLEKVFSGEKELIQ